MGRRKHPRSALFGLGIDPGETNFGLSLVAFNPGRVAQRVRRGTATPVNTRNRQPMLVDTDFEVRWLALWDLKAAGGGSGSLQSEVQAVVRLIHETPILRRLLGNPRLSVFIEIQEGGDWKKNPGLAQTMMRTGSLSIAFMAVFLQHGHRVRLVGKQSRWGWTSYKHTADFGKLNTVARRARGKACITLFVKDLVARQQAMAPDGVKHRPLTSDEPHSGRFYWRLASHQVLALLCGTGVAFDTSAHYSDGVVIAMFGLRRLIQPDVRHKNVILAPSWAAIAYQAVSRVPLWHGNQKLRKTPGGQPSPGTEASTAPVSASKLPWKPKTRAKAAKRRRPSYNSKPRW